MGVHVLGDVCLDETWIQVEMCIISLMMERAEAESRR